MPRGNVRERNSYEKGGTARVVTNAYATQFRTKTLFMYKCQFSSTRRADNQRVPKEDDVVGRTRLFKSIFKRFVELAYGIGVAFDNTRLFAFNFIPGTTTFADPNSRLGFSVTFVRVCDERHIDVNLEFGEKGRLMSESWNQAMHIILADSIARNNFRRVGRGYYNATAIDFDLSDEVRKATGKFLVHDSSGVQVWVGWKAKLEDAQCGLILKLARVTRQLASKSVWDEIAPVLKSFNGNSRKIADFIKREIRGRPVMTSYSNRVYRVLYYDPNLHPDKTFMWRGVEIKIVDYMRIVYNISDIDMTQGLLSFRLKKPAPGQDPQGFLVPSLCHFTGMPRKLTNFQRNSLRKMSGVAGEVRKQQMEDMVRMLCKTLVPTSENMAEHRAFRQRREHDFRQRAQLRRQRRLEYEAAEAKHSAAPRGETKESKSGGSALDGAPAGGGSALDEAPASVASDGQASEDSFVLNVESDKIVRLEKNMDARTHSDLEFDEVDRASVASSHETFNSAYDRERDRGLWFSDDEDEHEGEEAAAASSGSGGGSAERKANADEEEEAPAEAKKHFPFEIVNRIELDAKVLPTTKVLVRDADGHTHEVLMNKFKLNDARERAPLSDKVKRKDAPRIGFFSVALSAQASLKSVLYTLFDRTDYLNKHMKCPNVEEVSEDFVGEPWRDNTYFDRLEAKVSQFIKRRDINVLVFSIPEHKASLMIYETMKRVTLHKHGIISQGIKESNFRSSKQETIAHGIAKQILAKMARPARKLILDDDVKESFQNDDRLVMVCGVDVNHDWQRQKSTVGFCSTSDADFTRVFSQVSYQDKRQEVISRDLTNHHMKAALTDFFEKSKNARYVKRKAAEKAALDKERKQEEVNPPKRRKSEREVEEEDEEAAPKLLVLMYRDGVSESQFDACTREEICGMREGFNEFVADVERFLPRATKAHYRKFKMELVFTVVQKRVDLKINMPNLQQAVPQGTVIDHTVTSNKFTDFYMIPHDSRRPGGDQSAQCTRFIRLREPNPRRIPSSISGRILHKFTNGLCSLHPTWTGPIRVPHVVKAADLVANQWGTIIQDAANLKPKQWDEDGEKTWIHDTPFYL